MQIKEELAGQILEALFAQGDVCEPMRTEIVSILEHYSIEKKGGIRKGNILKYVRKFLSAKRIEGLSEKTLKNYSMYLNEFATSHQKSINRISADDIRQFVARKKLKDSSRQTILCTLRSFFGWLTREEIIRKNPTLKIPGIRLAKKRIRKAMTQETWEKYCNAAIALREKALLEFFYSTGCRVSEVESVNIAEVDFERRSVKIMGKGSKERVVYFSYKARVLLQEYLATRRDDCPALFINTRGGQRMSVRSMQKVIARIGQRAALQERTHPHKIRHSMADHNLNKGMNVVTLQRLLGHENPNTTQIYAQMNERNIIYEYDQFAA